MKKIGAVLILILMATGVLAEDWQGYVLRNSFWGVDYYWVFDDAQKEDAHWQSINEGERRELK